MSKLIRIRSTVGICLLVLLLVGCVSGRRHRKRIEELKVEVVKLQVENQELKDKFMMLQVQRGRLIQESDELRRRLPLEVTSVSGLDLVLEQLRGKGVDLTYRSGYPTVILSGIFSPGKETVSPRAAERLITLGKAIKEELPACSLRVDGYSDNQPIRKTKKYKSNKALSSARAQFVADLLKTKCGFMRVDSRGLGEVNPIADNKTAVGRAKNRRVEIVILVKEAGASY